MNTVEAASKAEVDMIHAALNKKYGQLYADIWKVGVNVSLRIGDLLALKYANLNLEERTLKLTEAKTGKLKCIRLNAPAITVIVRRQQEQPTDTWLAIFAHPLEYAVHSIFEALGKNSLVLNYV